MNKFASIKDLYNIYIQCSGVSIDSRTVGKGDMFFALKGPNFDGHKYVKSAFERGAKVAIIEDEKYLSENSVLVENVESSLQNLAKFYRLHLSIPIIGLTGSNGKTTTKELVKSVLSRKMKAFATDGNLNNHLGVPLSLLAISKNDDVAIIEMGANHPGEIKMLSEIAMPDIGLITNIGKAHLEGFINLEGVRKAKTELYDYLRKVKGQFFVNTSDHNLDISIKKEDSPIKYNLDLCRVLDTFPHLTIEYKGQEIRSQLSGSYNASNVLAAIAVGEYFKMPLGDIIIGVESYRPENNRSQIKKTKLNSLILDAYNANPSSMRASIDNIASSQYDKKVLLIGHMLEVGKTSTVEHQELIDFISKRTWHQVILIGSEFEKCSTKFPIYTNTESLIQDLEKYNLKGCTILLKGSRGIALEKIVSYL